MCIYVYMYVYVYTYIYIYVYIYTYIPAVGSRASAAPAVLPEGFGGGGIGAESGAAESRKTNIYSRSCSWATLCPGAKEEAFPMATTSPSRSCVAGSTGMAVLSCS